MERVSWNLSSWRTKPCAQEIKFPQQDLEEAANKLKSLPPLVSFQEVDRLRESLRQCARGERFLLQGGDCAELFEYCSSNKIENKLKVLLQMSLVLVWGGRLPVVRIARMAGQYAKPRSNPTEVIDGKEYPSFRGDIINGYDLRSREVDASRLVSAYFHAAATLNYVRSLLSTNFADLHKSSDWTLDHIINPEVKEKFEKISSRLNDSLDFMETIGETMISTKSAEIFMSHEGLVLDYEEALTRQSPDGSFYNLGAHFLWIGDRTRQIPNAHVEYFRGIKNPIGVKVGPSLNPEELIDLLNVLDPNFEIGKITLITRYGSSKIKDILPLHIKAVQKTSHRVVWCCDPMHGNTIISESTGRKTREFSNVFSEVKDAIKIHKSLGSRLNGIHLELTGDPGVTECLGGTMNIEHIDLLSNYQTFCDPRLNYEQSLDIAFSIAEYHEERRRLE